ncbi:MAG: thrombospondin type 3 repeat-containing protein [Kiritimatiellia bacterium]|jgi:hypothetical protein
MKRTQNDRRNGRRNGRERAGAGVGRALARALALGCLAATTSAFGQSGALPPFTFVGKVRNDSGMPYGTNALVEIRVKNLDGDLLAKTGIRVSTESPYNYRLAVPVASAPAAGYATTGESLLFEVYDGAGTTYASLVPAEQALVGKPGGIGVVNFSLSVDANENGIPDEYENYLAYLMALEGIPGPYDPEADTDGDGFTNRAEFLAGTDPLNAADKLAIAAAGACDVGMTDDGLFAITFVTAAGRAYSVRATVDLAAMDRAEREPFRVEPGSTTLQTYLHTPGDKAEAVTLYLIPRGATRFYRIVLE